MSTFSSTAESPKRITVYLVCGVSGSGKTWVCKQLANKFTYVPHDEHFKDHVAAVFRAGLKSDKPVITEVPFAERDAKTKLEYLGCNVIPIFVVETPETVRKRYFQREGKEPQKAALTRAVSITERAKEWKTPMGTSSEVLKYLQGI